jgi:hypothetical protein
MVQGAAVTAPATRRARVQIALRRERVGNSLLKVELKGWALRGLATNIICSFGGRQLEDGYFPSVLDRPLRRADAQKTSNAKWVRPPNVLGSLAAISLSCGTVIVGTVRDYPQHG